MSAFMKRRKSNNMGRYLRKKWREAGNKKGKKKKKGIDALKTAGKVNANSMSSTAPAFHLSLLLCCGH